MLICPLAVLLALGVQSRTASPEFESYAYPESLNERILAYSEYMALAKAAGVGATPSPSYEQTLIVARAWAVGIDKGELRDLPSANALDTVREGPKSQIRDTIQFIESGLYRAIIRKKATTEAEKVEATTLALKLTGLLKYSDLYGVGYCSMRQRMWLDLIGDMAPKLSPKGQRDLLVAVKSIDHSETKIDLLIDRAERQYMADGKRLGESRLAILDPEAALKHKRPDGQIALKLAALTNSSDDPVFSRQVNGIQFARSSFKSEEAALSTIVAQLAELAN